MKIVENKITDDLSNLESIIDEGLNSGISSKSHDEIISDIKSKYANKVNSDNKDNSK